jgi:phage repressor protein C with HTH and peptisase S24 domain
MIGTKNSREAVMKRAEARFKQEERALDGRKAMTEYEAQVLTIREKTAHLRALRLAKEAQPQNEEPPPKTNVRPLKNRGTR